MKFITLLILSLILDPVLRPAKIKVRGAHTTVVIDPGAGGDDQTDLTLKVALKLRENLQNHGLKSVLTREEKGEVTMATYPARQ
jgi:N-acetylmuramoyl-L-alanine amidase